MSAGALGAADAITADQVAELLELQPLPGEGGRFRRMYGDEHSSAIYYLFSAGDFSALHALTGPEVYHFHAGAPVRMLLLDNRSGAVAEPVLGIDLVAGERPQLVVPAGVWQGGSSLGDWSLVGTTMAPGYADKMFTLGDRSELAGAFPSAAERIAALTRS